jgi:hypothetical protein
MSDGVTAAGWLLVVGPIIGAISASNPILFPVWSASREDQLRIVRAHVGAWLFLNAGFFLATVVTAAGLVMLALSLEGNELRTGVLVLVAVVYAIAGGLWCAVLAIRSRTTPALADLVAAGAPTEPAETVLGAATGGLFAAFTLATGAALVVLGLTLALAGGVATPIALLSALIAGIVIGAFMATGDAVPAVLYIPTLLIGLALRLGWT